MYNNYANMVLHGVVAWGRKLAALRSCHVCCQSVLLRYTLPRACIGGLVGGDVALRAALLDRDGLRLRPCASCALGNACAKPRTQCWPRPARALRLAMALALMLAVGERDPAMQPPSRARQAVELQAAHSLSLIC